MIFITLWLSHLALLNSGTVALLWSVTPLLVAIADYILFR